MDEPNSQVLEGLKLQFKQGKISRRDFFRSLAVLGISVGASNLLAACGLQPSGTPYPTAYNPVFNDPTIIAVGKTMQANGNPSELDSPVVAEAAPYATVAPPKEITWMCESCGQHFQTVDALKTHAAETHAKRLPETSKVDQPTYAEFLVGKVERFDERNTALSRTNWDQSYQAKMGEAMSKAPQPGVDALQGQALVAGAIYVDDAVGSLHPNYTGYMGHMKDTGGLYSWEDPVSTDQFPIPDPVWMSAQVKDVARFYGANLVGITQVNPLWIYSHYYQGATGDYAPLEMSYTYAIVMGIEMDWQRIRKSPKYDASAATALAYSRMAELSASLAKFIRALGYPALPCGNDTAQSIPLAIDAGLGELGRNGLLLSPEYGPRQRLCKVFTDLPLQPDKPVDFGMRRFCETCHACAGACPANAIQKGDRTAEPTSISNRQGIMRWPVNVSDCFLFWLQNNGVDCSNCISACPWALRSTRDWLET
ncbi:MAG TPA: reductive dehalogenase [Anaerolineales bacterium]|nr:reductive dehalogenase [Anaerolineales bacterium]